MEKGQRDRNWKKMLTSYRQNLILKKPGKTESTHRDKTVSGRMTSCKKLDTLLLLSVLLCLTFLLLLCLTFERLILNNFMTILAMLQALIINELFPLKIIQTQWNTIPLRPQRLVKKWAPINLGKGYTGSVDLVRHEDTGYLLAVKKISCSQFKWAMVHFKQVILFIEVILAYSHINCKKFDTLSTVLRLMFWTTLILNNFMTILAMLQALINVLFSLKIIQTQWITIPLRPPISQKVSTY